MTGGLPLPFNKPWLVGSLALLATCWALLWLVRSYWNPLFFFGLWTAAIWTARNLAGRPPGQWRRHLALSILSVPLWWWFEFVNRFLGNWSYHGTVEYTPVEYRLFASVAFSTVIPALDAAWQLATRFAGVDPAPSPNRSRRWYAAEAAVGVAGQVLVFVLPHYFYPWAWIAPFLILDAAVGIAGKPSLLSAMAAGRWRLPLTIGLAGIGCGFCWELWNVAAMPKWTYSVPFLHFLQVFEIPLLGYLGYVPFSWSVYQLVGLGVARIGATRATPRYT
ncbi:MAG: hypothetical protein EXR51_05670 [Dehalococcoidia bacterium]|nr:hypothetical protein [Dehalococcoidia bacterium]